MRFLNYKNYITICFLLVFNYINAQSPAGIWYFGEEAGLDFNSGPNPQILNDGEIITFEGCATLGDSFGNLLFYTDGINVWNINHDKMPNGTGLLGDPSSTQSAIIVPKPNTSNLYYIFTVDELAKPNGLNYSVVDMNLDNGFGDIIQKNIPLLSPTLEKVNAIKHFNENDYWLITHKYNSNQFYKYLITQNGVSNVQISAVGDVIDGSSANTIGYLKSSPNGRFLAIANAKANESKVQIFKFDNNNGNINLMASIQIPNSSVGLGVYGLEFSNDSSLLYISNINNENKKSQIFQFDLQSENEVIINNSIYLVTEVTSSQNNTGVIGALQLAPNKKIYVAKNNLNSLAVINNPDELGINCQFDYNGISLGNNKSYYGLPLFVSSLFDISFKNNNNCFGDLTQFEIPNIQNIVSVNWNFGDPSSLNNTSTLHNPTHLFTSTGVFIVSLTIQTTLRTTTYNRPITVVDHPVANPASNLILCDNQNNSASFDLLSKKNEILGTQSSNDYNVTFHLTQFDADNNINPLSNNYQNTSNPQIIYARVQPLNSLQCYATTSFQIKRNEPPLLQEDSTLFYCKDKFPNTISLNNGLLENSNAPYSFLWSTGETTPTIEINQSGNYSVLVTDSNNCASLMNITVLNSETANISLQVNNSSSTLTVLTEGIGNYVFSIDNENSYYQTSNVFYNIEAGNHTVYVKDLNGCDIQIAPFFIVNYPKYFTPNSDGINDYWFIKGDENNVKNIKIFDRFGKLIKFLNSNEKWDGTLNNKHLFSSDYWFELTLNTNEVIKGHFSLIR